MSYTLERPAADIFIAQPTAGYRYTSEALLLTGLALERAPRSALDLGTGSGVMALLLGARGTSAVGVDSFSMWAPLWRHSLQRSQSQARLVCQDILLFQSEQRFDVVVCNPPFFPGGSGPSSPNPWRSAGRTESTAGLEDFVVCALRYVCEMGTFLLAIPLNRSAEACETAKRFGWSPVVVYRLGRRGLFCFRKGSHQAVHAELDEPMRQRLVALATAGYRRR